MRWTCLGVALAVALAVGEAHVAISVRPAVLFEGGAVWLRCWVPRDPANRYLEWGISDYRTARIELDGDKAPANNEWTITHVPCDVGQPFCRLQRADGARDVLVTQPIQVTCRNEP